MSSKRVSISSMGRISLCLGGTESVEVDWSAREWTSERICGVTLYVKLRLRRFKATAAARNTASRMYFVSLEAVSLNQGTRGNG